MKTVLLMLVTIVGFQAHALDLNIPSLKTSAREAAADGAKSAAQKAMHTNCSVSDSDITLTAKSPTELKFSVFATCPQFEGDRSGLNVVVTVKGVIRPGQILYYSSNEQITSAPSEALR